ncbi:hypothetical protein M2317_001313 [Microbacterium sp. ZKA21]|uniref:hypothetical protein n=1 Tax=Microbacterium sp. ZKA21 TaxID=3381694 RepID=UPI003D1F52E5
MITTEPELYEFVETLRPSVATSPGLLEVFDILMAGGEPWEALTSMLEDPDAPALAIPEDLLARIRTEILPEFCTPAEQARYLRLIETMPDSKP